ELQLVEHRLPPPPVPNASLVHRRIHRELHAHPQPIVARRPPKNRAPQIRQEHPPLPPIPIRLEPLHQPQDLERLEHPTHHRLTNPRSLPKIALQIPVPKPNKRQQVEPRTSEPMLQEPPIEPLERRLITPLQPKQHRMHPHPKSTPHATPSPPPLPAPPLQRGRSLP